MDVSEQVAFWRTSAREDFEAACELVEAGRTRHGMFFAHLAIEKALKAHVCMRTSRVPPRVHNLVRLAEFARLSLTEAQIDLLAEMNAFNIEGRYPDMMTPPLNESEADQYLRRTEEALEWLIPRS